MIRSSIQREEFVKEETRGKLKGNGLQIEITSVRNGVDQRAFVVFKR